jgi:hypothetical protein
MRLRDSQQELQVRRCASRTKETKKVKRNVAATAISLPLGPRGSGTLYNTARRESVTAA